MRSYIRVDPHLPERKLGKGYSPAQVCAYIALLGQAEQQPERGQFKTWAVLRAAMDSTGARLSRHLSWLLEQGDLVERADGSWYVVGWEEWQEGDLTVAERMRRVRAKNRNAGNADTRNDRDAINRNGSDEGERSPLRTPYEHKHLASSGGVTVGTVTPDSESPPKGYPPPDGPLMDTVQRIARRSRQQP